MRNNMLKLLCVILVFNCAVSKRISELKCEDTDSLNTDSRSLYPHLVEIIVHFPDRPINTVCMATLISSDFVLTSAACLFKVPAMDTISIRKFKLPEEQYTEFSSFLRIKRLIPHELYNKTSVYNIGLIQLDQAVPYHNSTSVFRPACIWPNTHPPSDKYYTYGKVSQTEPWNRKFKIIPLTALRNDESNTEFRYTSDGDSDFFNTFTFPSTLGSPIEVEVRNRNYVFAIVSSYMPVCKGIQIGTSIAWIESIVWPNEFVLENQSNLDCGERKVKHKPLMTRAQPTYHGEFPWHVGIYRNNQTYICGGTIISNRAILTAAHCVQDDRGVLPPNRLSIVAGTSSLNEYPIEARNYNVNEVKVHQNYSRDYLENDIAILKLSSTIEFTRHIQPICLNNSLVSANMTVGVVAGWGRDENDVQSDRLLQATLPLRDNFDCRESNRDFFPNYLNDHNYCAGYDNGTSLCSGDSGGGMIVLQKSRWYLRGIVSLGVAVPNSDKCDVTQLILFTDVPKLYNWIMINVQGD